MEPTTPTKPVSTRPVLGGRIAVGVAVFTVLFAACSGADNSATSSVEPSEPTAVSEGNTGSVSFSDSIQPVLEANCASCHSAGGPGAAHFELETAGDAQDNAIYIASVVDVGYMPPWPAGSGDLAFHDDRRLSDSDKDAIFTWFDEGSALDVEPATPIESTSPPPLELNGDVVMAGVPYKGSSAIRDDYRCQIYDPELTDPSFLTSYDFEADRSEIVHHVIMHQVGAESRAKFEALAAEDPEPGWSCIGMGANSDPRANQVLSWAPGLDPTILPVGTGIEMQPGDFFVAQIHYHYEPVWDDLPADASRVIADFADAEEIAAAGGTLDPIDLSAYQTPAEIPCAPHESGPLCDRAASVADMAERTGGAALMSNLMNRRCGLDPADITPQPDGKASTTCDLPAEPGEIVWVWAHMHELGDWFKMTLNPDTPEEVVLLDIPSWNFDWQLNYSPVEAVVINEGDTVRVECGWDANLRKPELEPRYVMWGEGTDDEMCISNIVTRPAVDEAS